MITLYLGLGDMFYFQSIGLMPLSVDCLKLQLFEDMSVPAVIPLFPHPSFQGHVGLA